MTPCTSSFRCSGKRVSKGTAEHVVGGRPNSRSAVALQLVTAPLASQVKMASSDISMIAPRSARAAPEVRVDDHTQSLQLVEVAIDGGKVDVGSCF
jgi:hypothetical protein